MSARAGVLALGLAACAVQPLPPAGQLVVYVDTDAPLALAPGQALGAMDAPPLFDRLRVEIVDAQGDPACDACADDFSVDRAALARGALSFGVRPPVGRTGLVVRARLFRGARARGASPRAEETIDRAMRLPPIAAEGIVEVTVPLLLDALGQPADPASVDDAPRGKQVRAALRDGVAPTTCTTDGGDGQVCVPGGAYWMSDPLVLTEALSGDPPARVAIVSPFWLDADEVTVGALRASKLASSVDPVRARSIAGCTYTDAPGASDALPATCVTWTLAARYCDALGGRLPTEAELEFAAGARASQRYPWGTDDPACGDAVFARAVASNAPAYFAPPMGACTALGTGAAATGSGARDVLALPGGEVRDLAGNAAEWASDAFEELGGDCWHGGLVVDPACAPSGAGPAPIRAVRGGSWLDVGAFTRSTRRAGHTAATGAPSTGFRCARTGR